MILESCLVLTLAAPQPAARDLLRQAYDHYRHLSGFSMRIEHEDSSGLFPGRYTQTLRWRRGGRFELQVVSSGNRRVPDYYADGQHVLMIQPGNVWITEPLQPEPNTAPGWEVSGGAIMGWLQDTPSGRFWLDPPRRMPIQWELGPRASWQGRAVRELRATLPAPQPAPGISLFLDAQRPLLIGFEWTNNNKLGWAVYADQQPDPPLPVSLGDSPAVP
jgi:hypothetical protein